MEESSYGRYVVRKPMSHGLWDGYDFVGEEDYGSDVSFIMLKVEEYRRGYPRLTKAVSMVKNIVV